MRKLTSLDTYFLSAEDGRTNMNISSLAILDATRDDGTVVARADIRALFAQRLHLLPPLRWRLAKVPFGLAHPHWVDGEVDLDFHVRAVALPAPGDDEALHELVAELAAQPMDRDRPLWEVYLIHGLSDDRVALLTKMHHAALDGVSGAELMNVLLDGSPAGRAIAPTPARRAEREPGRLGMLLRGLADLPRQPVAAVNAVNRALPYLDHVPTFRAIPGVPAAGGLLAGLRSSRGKDGEILGSTTATAPLTRFNGRISAHRQVAFTSLPLSDVKRIKDIHGTTVNDVVVSLCAGALRSWLASTGDLPRKPLVAMVPVSVRRPQEQGTYGNRIGAMVVPIPTDEPEPQDRLRRCQEVLSSAKDAHDAVPATLLRDANDLVPPLLFGPVMRTITQLSGTESVNPAVNVVISNVPGSGSPLYCTGARVLANFPVSAISDSMGLNITVFSYQDRLDVGLVGDRDLVPDIDELAAAMAEELQVLLAQAPARARAATVRPARKRARRPAAAAS